MVTSYAKILSLGANRVTYADLGDKPAIYQFLAIQGQDR